jgi:hypothetical protein
MPPAFQVEKTNKRYEIYRKEWNTRITFTSNPAIEPPTGDGHSQTNRIPEPDCIEEKNKPKDKR